MMLSVIIPVYNVESTLARCVGSVLKQGVADLEVVLVDDGSTDGSLALCRRLASGDQRIRLITQPNGGLSSARNAGIAASHGDYITFVDSDDHLSAGTYGSVLREMEALHWPDMVEYGVRLHVGAPWQSVLSFNRKVYASSADYWFVARVWGHCYACNKLFRRRLFHTVNFPEGKSFEDVWTMPLILRQCHTVATLPVVGYNYVYNPSGITSTADATRFSDLLDAELAALALLPEEERNRHPQAMAQFYQHILNDQLTAYELGATRLKLPMLPYNDTLKLKLLHTIGLKRLCILNKLIHKIRPPRH